MESFTVPRPLILGQVQIDKKTNEKDKKTPDIDGPSIEIDHEREVWMIENT